MTTVIICAALNIVLVIKSRRMGWARHVARIGRREVFTGFVGGNLRERDHLEDPGVNGRLILKCILRKLDVSGLFVLYWRLRQPKWWP